FFVVEDGAPLDGLFGNGQVYDDDPCFVGRGGFNSQLQGVQHPARVAIGNVYQVVEGVGLEFDLETAVPPLRVAQCLQGDLAQVVVCQWLQLEDAAAADEGFVDFEVGVLGGGPDEDDHAVVDVGQEGVLLGLV